MKRYQKLLIPQKEFGFTKETFNLIQEWTLDGERICREREAAARKREQAARAQTSMFPGNV